MTKLKKDRARLKKYSTATISLTVEMVGVFIGPGLEAEKTGYLNIIKRMNPK